MKTISKNVHQIWGNDPLPEKYKLYRESFMKHHKDWKYKMWSMEECRQLIEEKYNYFLKTYDSYKFDIQRCDAARVFILNEVGGLYIDTDICFYKNIESLINDNVILFYEYNRSDDKKNEKYITNAIMYNNNSLFFNKLTKQLTFYKKNYNEETDDRIKVLKTTGPIQLTTFYNTNKYNFEILSADYFEKYENIEDVIITDDVYGIHEHDNRWIENKKVVL